MYNLSCLFSHKKFEQVHDHYRNLTHVTLPNARKVCFRFCDPSILSPFLDACSTSEKSHWMGPAKYIMAEHHGRYDVKTNPDTVDPAKKQTTHATTGNAPKYWWRMKAHHLAAFKQHTEKALISNISYSLWRDFPDVMTQYPTEDIDAMLRPSSSKARRNGVTDEQGLTRYALVMMTINPQFDAHPQVQEFLSRSSSSPSQKIKMEALSEAKWREISSANLVDDWPRIFEVEMTGVKH